MPLRRWSSSLCLTFCGWGCGSETTEPGANAFLVGITSVQLYRKFGSSPDQLVSEGNLEPNVGLNVGMEITGREEVIILAVTEPTVIDALTSSGEALTATSGDSISIKLVRDPANAPDGPNRIRFYTDAPQREAVSLKRLICKATIAYTKPGAEKSIEIKTVPGTVVPVTAFPHCDMTIGQELDGGIECTFPTDHLPVIRTMTFLDADGQRSLHSSTTLHSNSDQQKVVYGDFTKPVATVVLKGYTSCASVRATIEVKSLPFVGMVPATLVSPHPVRAIEAIMTDPSQLPGNPKTP